MRTTHQARIRGRSAARHFVMLVLAALLPFLLAVSCRSDLLVQNRTDMELTVRVESDTNPQEIGIKEGSSDTVVVADDTCLDGPLVAVNQATGDEIARSDEPACSGDIWVIENDRNDIRD